MSKKSVHFMYFMIFCLVLSISIMYLALADHIITTSTGGTAYNINEDIGFIYNITVNNTDISASANITQVNITLPASFSFIANSQGTSSAANYTFTNTTSILSWTKNGLVMNLSREYFWFNATAPTPGNYIITIATLNGTNNNMTVFYSNISVIVNDTTSPTISIITPANTTYNNATQLINISTTGDYTWFTNSTGVNETYTTPIYRTFSEGSNTLLAWTNDTTGNTNSTSVIFSIDTTSPTINFTNPTITTGNYSQTAIWVNVTATAGGGSIDTIKISLYNSSNSEINSTSSSTSPVYINFTSLSDGTYYLNATVNNSVGNSNNTETRTVLLDTTSPSFVNLTGKSVASNASLSHTITATDSGVGVISCYTVNNTNLTINCSGSLTNASTLSIGTYNLNITVNDSLNNVKSDTISIVVYNITSQQYATNESITVTQNTTEVIVDSNSPALQEVIIPANISSNTTITLNFAPLLNSGNVTVGSSNVTMRRTDNTTNTNYTAEIQASTIISGGSSWNGEIILPITNTSSFTAPSGSTDVVIDLGPAIELNFSKAVKITISGMAGKSAAWARGSASLTDISTQCNNLTAPTNINATTDPRECYIDSGNDLVIWSYHFTSFAAYTPSSTTTEETSSSSGGTGGTALYWITTYLVSDKQFQEGYTKELAKKKRLRIKIDNKDHYVGVIDLTETKATINVSSDPIQIILGIGDEEKFDLTDDNYYDLLVKLNSIEDNKANITIQNIYEEIPIATPISAPEEGANATIGTTEETAKEITNFIKNKKLWLVLIIIAIIVIAVIIFLLISKKKRYYLRGY